MACKRSVNFREDGKQDTVHTRVLRCLALSPAVPASAHEVGASFILDRGVHSPPPCMSMSCSQLCLHVTSVYPRLYPPLLTIEITNPRIVHLPAKRVSLPPRYQHSRGTRRGTRSTAIGLPETRGPISASFQEPIYAPPGPSGRLVHRSQWLPTPAAMKRRRLEVKGSRKRRRKPRRWERWQQK